MFIRRFTAMLAVGALAAGAALLAPTAALAAEGDVVIEGDTYTKVIWHRDMYVGSSTWDAKCPDGFPWLDVRQGTPRRHVGRGVLVSESSLIVRWDDKVQLRLVPDPVTGILDRHGVGGISGSVVNAILFPIKIGVEIKMACTRNPNHAWIW